MDTEESTAQIEEGAPETTESNHEVEYGAEAQYAAEYAKQRLEELGLAEEPTAEEGQGEEVVEATPEEPAEEGAEEVPDPPEATSRAARRALQREKKLRQEREEFSKQQEQWRAEQEETRAKVESFEKSRQNAQIDPVSHLLDVGLSKDELLDVAREIYYDHMPEAADSSVRAEMAAIKRERRLKRLELGLEEKKAPEPEPEPDKNAAAAQYEAQYRAGLNQFAATVDAEEFPHAAAYAKKDFNDLVAGMFNAALQNAQQSDAGGDLTPRECMAKVEEFLKAHNQQNNQAAPQQTEEPPPEQKKKAPLRNKVTAARPNDKHESELSHEELVERSRARFDEVLRESGLRR
jgi:hypothetical protein